MHPVQELPDVFVQLLGAHSARDPAHVGAPAQLAGDGTLGTQQQLGVQLPQPLLLEALRQVLAQHLVQPAVAARPLERAPDRGRHQQVALDVPTAPGEEAEAGFGVARPDVLRADVAVQHAEAMGFGVLLALDAQVLDGARGPSAPEDHRRGDQGAGQHRRGAVRPAAQDVPVPRSLDVDEEAPGARCVRGSNEE